MKSASGSKKKVVSKGNKPTAKHANKKAQAQKSAVKKAPVTAKAVAQKKKKQEAPVKKSAPVSKTKAVQPKKTVKKAVAVKKTAPVKAKIIAKPVKKVVAPVKKTATVKAKVPAKPVKKVAVPVKKTAIVKAKAPAKPVKKAALPAKKAPVKAKFTAKPVKKATVKASAKPMKKVAVPVKKTAVMKAKTPVKPVKKIVVPAKKITAAKAKAPAKPVKKVATKLPLKKVTVKKAALPAKLVKKAAPTKKVVAKAPLKTVKKVAPAKNVASKAPVKTGKNIPAPAKKTVQKPGKPAVKPVEKAKQAPAKTVAKTEKAQKPVPVKKVAPSKAPTEKIAKKDKVPAKNAPVPVKEKNSAEKAKAEKAVPVKKSKDKAIPEPVVPVKGKAAKISKKLMVDIEVAKQLDPSKEEDEDIIYDEEIDLNSIDLQTDEKDPTLDKKNAKVAAKHGSVTKNDTMKVYMHDIGQISLVTKDQEVDLAAKIHGDDNRAHDEARATLIKANLRLVVKIAHDFKGLGLPLLDLISEGNIGLMRAVEKFDPAKGAKFSSYAAWWIKQSMRRALANQSRTIRIPVQSAGKINKIKSVRMKLTEKLGREPTDAEIAENLDYSERTVAGLRLADLRTFSLHDPIQQGEDGEFQDIIPDRGAMTPDRILSDVESVGRLMDLLRDLDERERMILKMRFGLDGARSRTLEEVSQEIGRTRERVRQIQNQALSKLRAMLADEAGFANE